MMKELNLQVSKAWKIGLLILILNVILSELSINFDNYVYHRLGINRNYLIFFFWLFPFIASYISSYYSIRYKLLLSLSYIIIFPALASFGHYINGQLGGAVDFVGPSGIIVFFKIHFVISSIIIVVGTLLGLAFSKSTSQGNDLNEIRKTT